MGWEYFELPPKHPSQVGNQILYDGLSKSVLPTFTNLWSKEDFASNMHIFSTILVFCNEFRVGSTVSN